jgi:pathogenesis-related protein 1
MNSNLIIGIISTIFIFTISCQQKTETTPQNRDQPQTANSYSDENSNSETSSQESWTRESNLSEANKTDNTDSPSTSEETPLPPPPPVITKATPKPVNKTAKIVSTGSSFTIAQAKSITDYHNKVRKTVKAGNITWNSTVAAFAQLWANKLGSSGCSMTHRPKNKYGENLWMGTANSYTVVDAAKSWESEKKYYSGGKLNSKNWYKSGHYTQMVWGKSKGLGCGKVVCNGFLIVVCNYNPAGNFMGQKPY